MLILGVCGIIRSLSRVLLGFVLGVGLYVEALRRCGILDDIFVYLC